MKGGSKMNEPADLHSGCWDFVMGADATEEEIEDCVELLWGLDVRNACQVWHLAGYPGGGAWRITLAAGCPVGFAGMILTLMHSSRYYPRELERAIHAGAFGERARRELGKLREAERLRTLNGPAEEASQAWVACCCASEHKAGEAKQNGERLQEEAKEGPNRETGFSANDFAPLRPVTVSPCADSVRPPEETRGETCLRIHGRAEAERALRLITERDVEGMLRKGPSPGGTAHDMARAVALAVRKRLDLVQGATYYARDLRREGQSLERIAPSASGVLRDAGDRLEGLAHLFAGDPARGVSLLLLSGWVPERWCEEGGEG